jgi:hypothetical protein
MIGRVSALIIGALFLTASPAAAQGGGTGFGIGPRLTFVRGTGDLPDGSQRFTGAAVRLGGGKTALEIAMDFKSGVTGDLTERIKDYPIQGSLLIFPVRSRIAPYLLGGIGWYSQRVQQLGPASARTAIDDELRQGEPASAVLQDQTTRKIGYHAGFGGEVRVHTHVGLYGDYRYTFIRFGTDDEGAMPFTIPFAERLRMSHEGSMFAWGATFYF